MMEGDDGEGDVTREGERVISDRQREMLVATASGVDQVGGKAFTGHLIEVVTEEIALEGLDGITLQALKVRLEQRSDLEIEDFEVIAPAIWNQLKLCKNVKYYLLPGPRADLVHYRWGDYQDDRGNYYEPHHSPEDIYHYHPVEEKQLGIRGSCEHFHTRKDISNIARRSSYVQIVKGLGNRLVIVANQGMRERMLLGPNFKKHQNLTIIQYCIMERVGRARTYGEITRGKISSGCLNISPKTQFYMRKHLLKTELIKRQSVTIRFGNSKLPTITTVFHLPRFYKRFESVSSIKSRTIFNWLNSSPSKSVPVERITTKFSKHVLRHFVGQFPTLVETAWERRVSDKEDPRVLPVLGIDEDNETQKTKNVRVLRLLVADVSSQKRVIARVLEEPSQGRPQEEKSEAAGEEGNPDDGEQEVNITTASSYSDVLVLRPRQLVTSSNCLHLFRSLWRAGVGGLTMTDIESLLNITRLESRSCCRYITRPHRNACKEGVVKLDKQKAFNFTLVNFSSQDLEIQLSLQEKLMLAMSEIQRILEFVRKMEAKICAKKIKRIKLKRERKAQKINSNPDVKTITSQSIVIEEIDKPQDRVQRQEPETNSVVMQAPSEESQMDTKEKMPSATSAEQCITSPSSPSTSKSTTVMNACPQNNTCKTAVAASNVSTVAMKMSKGTSSNDSEDKSNSNKNAVEEIFRKNVQEREDSVDECIRKNMTRQRVAWTPSEDRLMLFSFIATSLFIPKYSYDKIFMCNSTQIRDILQKKSNGKSNKTSATIRRRLHFLLKRKTHFNWYVRHASQAVRNNFLYENFVKEHLPPPQQRIYWMPPFEALESVVDYLLCQDEAISTVSVTISGSDCLTISDSSGNENVSMTGVDTLLFLRQLKRAEFYWNGLLFAIFCKMGNTPMERLKFITRWKEISKTNNENCEQDLLSNLPVLEIDEIKEVQMECKELINGSHNASLVSPQDLFLEFCWKFLKFLAKNLNITFKNILMLGSLPSKGFQIVSFDKNMDLGNISNICLSLRECTNQSEIRMWTARTLILEQIFSGGDQMSKDIEEKLPMEKAVNKLHRCKVLVSPKGADVLRLNKFHLKNFLGGLPSYSYDEIWDLLRHVDEESKSVDVLACLNVGVLFTLVELTDYWTTKITVTEPIFSLNKDIKFYSEDESADEEEDLIPSSSSPQVPVVPLPTPASSTPPKNGSKPTSVRKSRKRKCTNPRRKETKENTSKKTGRPLKKRKNSKEDKSVIEMAECFKELSVEVENVNNIPPKSSSKKDKKKKNPKESSTPSPKKPSSPSPKKPSSPSPKKPSSPSPKKPSSPSPKKESSSSPKKSNVGLEEGENFLSLSKDLKTVELLKLRDMISGNKDKDSNITSGSLQQDSNELYHIKNDQVVDINFPNLEFEFAKTTSQLNRSLVGRSQPFSIDALKKLRRNLVDLVYHQVPTSDTTSSSTTGRGTGVPNLEKILNRYTSLFNMINIAGETGVSGAYLQTIFERQSLVQGLLYLLDARLIFSVGVTHRRFVSYNNLKDWLVPVKNPHDGKRAVIGHVVMRPWITAIGGLSWTTIDRLFTALVGQLQKPSMKLNELYKLFAPTLSPVEALILIESLAKLKYLVLYKIVEPKITLFSKDSPDKCDIEYNVDTLIDTDDVYVAVSPYITTLHSELHHAILITCKKKQAPENVS